MFVDIETDRDILCALYGSADLSRLGIEDVALRVPDETIEWFGLLQESAENCTGAHQCQTLQPEIHREIVTASEPDRQVPEALRE